MIIPASIEVIARYEKNEISRETPRANYGIKSEDNEKEAEEWQAVEKHRDMQRLRHHTLGRDTLKLNIQRTERNNSKYSDRSLIQYL